MFYFYFIYFFFVILLIVLKFLLIYREAINRAKEMVFEIVQRGDNPADRRNRGMGGGGPMGPPGMEMGGNASTVEISIPGPKVGLIIGKKVA